MGGWGSGRYEYASTPTVEECRHLDVTNFTDAVDRPGRGGPIYWGDPDDPEASVSIVFLSDDHLDALEAGEKLETTPVEDGDPDAVDDERTAAIYLNYTVTPPRGGESRDVSYLVRLEYTDCNFGGSRPWFRCPTNAGGCDRRVGKLYLPIYTDQGRFLCRECYDLGYRSSRTSGDDLKQAELRYRRAFAKADAENRRAHPNNAPYRPERPKGMHHDTFEDLLEDVDRAFEEWGREVESMEKELLDNLKRMV